MKSIVFSSGTRGLFGKLGFEWNIKNVTESRRIEGERFEDDDYSRRDTVKPPYSEHQRDPPKSVH